VLNEEDWSELELEEADAIWKAFGLRDRIAACQRYDVSVYAARRDTVPDEVRGELVSYLAG